MSMAVGRESLLQKKYQLTREQNHALRAEAREASAIAPLARYVHRRVAIDCDPQTEQMQAAVVRYLERAAARGGSQ